MSIDYSHLDSINRRLALHQQMLIKAEALKPSMRRDQQIEWSQHNIRMIRKERDQEIAYLGIKIPTMEEIFAEMEEAA